MSRVLAADTREVHMPRLARRLTDLPRSGIREVMELASELDGVIHLEVGEPHVPTPDPVVEAACLAARSGCTRYTPNAGLPSLRRLVAQRYTDRHRRPWGPESVVVVPGAVNGLACAVLAVADPGDEVLVPDPGWPNYTSICRLAGATAIPYPLHKRSNYELELRALEERITSRTRAVLVNSPHNPTGAVLSWDAARQLVELARRHDLFVLSDEVYEDFVFDGEHASLATYDSDGRVVTVTGVSKSYAMTGWRVGFVLASRELAAAVARLVEPLVSCASSVSQKAAEAALSGPQAGVERLRTLYRHHRDVTVDLLGAQGLLAATPRGGLYALVDISATGLDSRRFAHELLLTQKVAVAPGATFGAQAEGCVRVCFATELDTLREGLRRLAEFAAARSSVR